MRPSNLMQENLSLKLEQKTAKFIQRYTSKTVNIESEKYIHWKNFIVPSCIFENEYSACIFCRRKIKSSYAMRRHYNEQHYDEIPDGIFGSKTEYECVKCDFRFARSIHLKQHLTSDFHLKNLQQDKKVKRLRTTSFSNILESTHKVKIMTVKNDLTNNDFSEYDNDLEEYEIFIKNSKGIIRYKTTDDKNASKLDQALSDYMLRNISFNQ